MRWTWREMGRVESLVSEGGRRRAVELGRVRVLEVEEQSRPNSSLLSPSSSKEEELLSSVLQ